MSYEQKKILCGKKVKKIINDNDNDNDSDFYCVSVIIELKNAVSIKDINSILIKMVDNFLD